MIGKQQVQITGTQFAQGLATSDFLNDGGMGTESYNLSLTSQPGVVRATSDVTPSGTPSNGFVASCDDPRASGNIRGRLLCDSGGQTYYYSQGTSVGVPTLSTLQSLSPTSSSFGSSVSDMVGFRDDGTSGFIYVTSSRNISRIQYNHDDTRAAIGNWWTSTKSQANLNSSAPHRMLIFEGYNWITDANLLHRFDASETVDNSWLTLSSNEVINALGIDPQTGLMMLAVQTISDTKDLNSTRNYVYLYDGYSAKPRRKIPVDGMITFFYSVGGQVFVGMGNTIGVWNGNGVTFLRRMQYSGESFGTLPTKLKVSHFQNTLMVADGPNVLAFSDIKNGQKVWWPMYRQTIDGISNIDFLSYGGNEADSSVIPTSPEIIVAVSTTLRAIRPMLTTTAATGVFYTNNINFQRPVRITDIRVFTTGITTTAGIGNVQIVDENNATYTPAVSKYVVASANSPRYVFDFHFDKVCQTIQPFFTIDTQAFGIIRAVVYYDTLE